MIKVGIVGGTGYTGVELLRLLAQRTDVDNLLLRLSDLLPELLNLRGVAGNLNRADLHSVAHILNAAGNRRADLGAALALATRQR